MANRTSVRRRIISMFPNSFGLVLLLIALFGNANAQAATDGFTPEGLKAGAPAGSFQLSGFDNINYFNGNLNFTLPLLRAGGRGGVGYTIPLRIERKWLVVKHFNAGYVHTPEPYDWQEKDPGYGPGILIGRVIGLPGPNCNGFGNLTAETLTRLTFTAGDGTEYQLHDTTSLKGNSTTTTWADCDVGYTPNRGKAFVTDDGSGVTFVSDDDIYDAYNGGQTERIYPDGYLMLPDGSRYRIEGGYVRWIRDRNGNKITFTYGYGGVATITDSLNRVISIGYGIDPATAYNDHDEITWKGFDGTTRTIKIYFSQMSDVMRSGDSVQTYATLFPDLNGASSATYFNLSQMASSVELPNGKSYFFKYNRYGELARVELPTGGAIEYDYEAGISGGDASGSYGGNGQFIGKQVYRRVVQRRVYKDSGSTYEHKILITKMEDSSGGNLGYVDVETRGYGSPGTLLTKERHYFHGSAKVPTGQLPYTYSQWKDGKEWKTEAQNTSGTAINTTENTWQQPTWGNNWPLTSAETSDTVRPNNPKVTQTLSTLNETSQVAKQTFTYDAHFNQTDVYEFDYGSSSPPTYATRHSQTEYLTTNSVNSTNYAGPAGSSYAASDYHIRNLPAEQVVYSLNTSNGTETRIAQTEYEYDKYDTSTHHANLVARSGISGLDSSYASTSLEVRGNVTMVTRYADAAALTGAITTYQQYDVAGNVVAAIDAGLSGGSRATTAFDYSDRYGSPDNEAQSNSAPSELSSVSQTSYAFPTKVTNALSHEVYTQFDYYLGKPVNAQDVNGTVSSLAYSDTLDRTTQLVRGVNQTSVKTQITIAYNDTDHIVTTTSDRDSYNDNLLQKKSVYDGLGRTWRAGVYEGSSLGWSIVDTEFDALGRAYRSSNPYRASDLSGAINPSGIWTTTTYDALGRVIETQAPDSAKVMTAYDGARVLVTEPYDGSLSLGQQNRKQRISESDALGRLKNVWEITAYDTATVSVSFPNHSEISDGYKSTYQYDALDNLTTTTQQAGTSGTTQTRSFVYDSLKRLTSATNPESGTTSYSYDPNGNLTSKTDARSITFSYTYDALNRSTGITYSSYPNGSAGSVIGYDNTDASKFGKGRPWYNYNYTSGAGGELKYSYNYLDAYDALGRPLQKTQKFLTRDCGGCSYYTKDYTVTRTYDFAGNVKTQTYPSGRTVNYAYDAAGRLNEFKGKLGGTGSDVFYAKDIRYNARSQMIREEFGTNTASLYHRMHYNRRGQLFDIRLGTSNDTNLDLEDPSYWSFTNGGWNRGALRLYYGASLNDYNSVNPSQPDNNGNIHRMDHFVPTTLDGSGNITSWAMAADAYTYDQLNRLLNVSETPTGGSGSSFVQQYTYDRWGNRKIDTSATSNVGGGVTDVDFQVTTTNNRLLAPTDTGGGSDKMRYDAVGNLIWDEYSNPSNPARDFGYDAENHIGIVKNASGMELARYIYDPEGKRVRRIVSGTETWQVYGLDGELIAEYAFNGSTGSPQKEYGYRGGQMLVVYDSTETGDKQWQWLVTDHLGSPRMVVDRSGNLSGIRRHDYLPFGEELASSIGHRNASGAGYTADQVRQKFTGNDRDNETGLDFMQARYYGSIQGRFASVDPFDPILGKQGADDYETAEKELRSYLRQPQHWNRYVYALNNPLKYVDPDGMDPITVNLNIIYDANSNYTDNEKKKIRESYIAQAQKNFGKIDVKFNVTEKTGSASNLGNKERSIVVGAKEGAINAFFTRDNVGVSSEATKYSSGTIFISTSASEGANPRDLSHGIIHAAGIAGGNGYRGPTSFLGNYYLGGLIDYKPGSAEYHTEAILQYLEGGREPIYTYGYNSAKTAAPPTVTTRTTHTAKDMQVLKGGLQRYSGK